MDETKLAKKTLQVCTIGKLAMLQCTCREVEGWGNKNEVKGKDKGKADEQDDTIVKKWDMKYLLNVENCCYACFNIFLICYSINVDVRFLPPRLGFSYTSSAASCATDPNQEEPLQAVRGQLLLQQVWPAPAPPPPPPPPPCSSPPWRCRPPPPREGRGQKGAGVGGPWRRSSWLFQLSQLLNSCRLQVKPPLKDFFGRTLCP